MSDLLIGADPEVFVRVGTQFVSGHNIELGSKDMPQETEHGMVQNDGTALEFNVYPSSTRKDFVKNTRAIMKDLSSIVEKVVPEAELCAVPTVHFGREYLHSLPREVQALGCSPDYNAYTGEENPLPNIQAPFRTGAGHVHLGWTNGASSSGQSGIDHFRRCAGIARELDYFLGLPSLLWDKDEDRRALYGKAGAFRPKHYGVEYRVLSNAWLVNDELIGLVFNQSKKAYTTFMGGRSLFVEYGSFASDCIDNNVTNWRDLIDNELQNAIYGAR